eukprot:scaffold119041_cov39-Phaeocystis_antarctica.AAC.1
MQGWASSSASSAASHSSRGSPAFSARRKARVICSSRPVDLCVAGALCSAQEGGGFARRQLTTRARDRRRAQLSRRVKPVPLPIRPTPARRTFGLARSAEAYIRAGLGGCGWT